MKVSEVMSRPVQFIDASATVQGAAEAMARYGIGAVLVGSADRLEGILTDRDILIRVLVDGRHPSRVAVREVMSSTLFTCREDESIECAFQQMSEHQVRRLPVLDSEGRVVGIVTLTDLARKAGDPADVVGLLISGHQANG